MYKCTDCGETFSFPERTRENHNLLCAPYEIYYVCPKCKGQNITEIRKRYCRCCGKVLQSRENDYCSKRCKSQGEIAYTIQMEKYKHIAESPLYKTVRALEKYNKEHHTRLSYGQYVAFVLPDNKKEEIKKNGKRRKNKVS